MTHDPRDFIRRIDGPELHPPTIGISWWACQHPERPPDNECGFDRDCRACRIKLEACARMEREGSTGVQVDAGTGQIIGAVTAAEALEYWRGQETRGET